MTKRFSLLMLLASACFAASGPRRLVMVKVDGVPAGLLERYVHEHDPETGKSRLPWIDLVFQKQGTTVKNFYVRGISLSVPSWSLLDTGRHLVIHGNVEYDRYTARAYDYMNFFPFYFNYARTRQADMPGVEVLDTLGVPLLIDRYSRQQRYQGLQLYQRGVPWETLKESLIRRITSRTLAQLFNEWQTGFVLSSGLSEQVERELISKLSDPAVIYLDCFDGDYDHIAHLTNDAATQYATLKRLDAFIGRLWTAIESSPLAQNTVFVLVSDHGMNTDPSVLSQGYSLLDFFNSAEGGGHHVITNRHPLDQYKLRGLDPFVSEVITPSPHSLYLRDQSEQYPTALLDLDGNERACVHLRNSRFNELQILLQRLIRKDLSKEQREEATQQFYAILDEERPAWGRELDELKDELAALKRRIDREGPVIKSELRKWTPAERAAGLPRTAARNAARLRSWQLDFAGYTDYSRALSRLLATEPPKELSKLKIEDLIPRRAMGDRNTIYDLQNYVIGPDASGSGFRRVDYFALLSGLRVRNNVQAGVGNRPVDFIAVSAPVEPGRWPQDQPQHAIWLYESDTSQALILDRTGPAGLELRYVPIRSLTQDISGRLHFTEEPLRPGLPLRYFEDPDLNVAGDRSQWLAAWHTDREWLDAVHRTLYSNAIIGLDEELVLGLPAPRAVENDSDEALLDRFERRVRDNVQPDMLLLASNHWNFNTRGFNPGGNHGSFFRISTHSVLMLAGVGVPAGLDIDRPYDSLSFVPTVLSLAGTLRPGELKSFPGRPIEELVPQVSYNDTR